MVSEGGRRSLESDRMGMAGTSQTRDVNQYSGRARSLRAAWGVTTIWGGSKTDLDLLIESSMYTRVATALVAVATAPLVEEVIYRA